VAAGEVRAVACLSAAICGSALMAAQPASREIGCTCGRARTG
jgi:hypothetical protein